MNPFTIEAYRAIAEKFIRELAEDPSFDRVLGLASTHFEGHYVADDVVEDIQELIANADIAVKFRE